MDSVSLLSHRFSLRTYCILIFALALTVRLGIVFAAGQPHHLSRNEPVRLAITLAEHGAYSDPFSVPTGPTGHIPPANPLILALIFKLFGTGVAAETVRQILTCCVSSLRVALLPAFARRCGLSARVIVSSGLIGVFWISALDTEVKGDFGAHWEALLLLALAWLTLAGPRRTLLFGACSGILVLFNPVMILPIAALTGYSWVEDRTWKRPAIVGVCIVVFLAPWAIRNRITLGSWIWTRTSLGLELWCAYHPGANWSQLVNLTQEITGHPLHKRREAERMRQIGELRYNEIRFHDAADYIARHPREVAILVIQRAFYFWFPPGVNNGHRAVLGLFTIMAALGLYRIWRMSPRCAGLLCAVVVSFPITYYVFQWSSRYRYPIEWILVLAAAAAIAGLFGGSCEKRRLEEIAVLTIDEQFPGSLA